MIPNNSTTKQRKRMWTNKDDLARKALSMALEARREQNLDLTDPVAIYDAAERLGIDEVRFVDIPSLEELYSKGHRKILVSSHRPSGRQAFNCAHGLGHHLFGHGMCITEVNDGRRQERSFSPNEFLADTFAGFFLMPKTAICNGFARRGWDVKNPKPIEVYTIASWLGVGYSTLIQHMSAALRLISPAYADRLRQVPLSTIRSHVIGTASTANIVLVDRHWTGRAIDIHIGDILVASADFSTTGLGLQVIRDCRYGVIYIPTEPGCSSRLINVQSELCLAVRVGKANYNGRNMFRFDEDPDYEKQSSTFDPSL